MANTKITITFTKDDNSEDSYVHTFNNDSLLDRIIDAHQIISAENAGKPVGEISKNKARKEMVISAIKDWKLETIRTEQKAASLVAIQSISDILSTEV